MIIKSMSRKSMSFGQLLDYIDAPERCGPALLQNLTAKDDDSAAIRREFQENARLLPPRKNGNLLYHEVLAASDRDRATATPEVLEAMARRYLELRAPYALAYGRMHSDTACPHMHLLISANNIGSTKRLRLSRQRFQEIKKELERFQRESFPQLRNSIVIDPERRSMRKRPTLGRRESEQQRRLRCTDREQSESQKERVRKIVLRELMVASSGEEFFRYLQGHDLHLYRRGQSVSIEDRAKGRRYRLKTLGLAEDFAAARRQWQILSERRQQLERQRRGREPPALTR